ncbi:MAG: leucine-rich repeat protein, partial [Lachnospiraceae bacterium]|nr:leucine-rich repeat protein [Lachnospiraceae bacterium]
PEDVEYPQGKYSHDKLADGTYAMTGYDGSQSALTSYWTIGEDDGTVVPVTAVGADVFRGNKELKLFRVNRSGNFTTVGENAFRDSGLEAIDLFDTVTTLEAGALQDCAGITELTLPESLAAIGENALSGLTGLESVTVKCDAGLLPEGVFANLPNLKTVTVEKGAVPAGFAEGSPVENLVLGEGVTAIGDRAFADTAIGSLAVPNIPLGADCFKGVKSSALTAAADASDETVAALTEMTGAPWYRPVIRAGEEDTFLLMPDTPNSEDDFLFNSETGTVELYTGSSETLVIPKTIGGVEVRAISSQFGDRMRDYTNTEIINNQTEWTHVRTLVIPETVTEIGDSAFSYCQQLESVVCYAPLETTGRATFMFCTNLKEALFLNPIKAIDNYCFDECPALENVWYGNTLDFIGAQAFRGCGLRTFIADAKVIKEAAFMECVNLTEAHIRGSIEKMELSAFGKCTALDLICLETLDDEVFTGDNGYSGECGGDTKLIIPAEADEKQARYLLRKWHTGNFGPIKDEEHVLKQDCPVPENPPKPER